MSHTYKYPHPAVTTDIVVFTVRENALKVLLIKRNLDPFKNRWALPGGFLRIDEDLEAGANRELAEETGLEDIYLEQLYTFGAPDRDPRERVISVAYFALVPSDKLVLSAGSDASEAAWFDIGSLKRLAFDHMKIVETARARLTAKLEYSTIGLMFMPDEFTLSEVQTLYEIIAGETRDKRNFRKWLLSLDVVEETGQKKAQGAHRPAMMYRLKGKRDVKIVR